MDKKHVIDLRLGRIQIKSDLIDIEQKGKDCYLSMKVAESVFIKELVHQQQQKTREKIKALIEKYKKQIELSIYHDEQAFINSVISDLKGITEE